MSKKYVVTGGAGFIGSHIVDALVARGDEVHVLDDFSSGLRQNIHLQAVVHQVDIRDIDAVRMVINSSIDGVFHCAAIVSVQYSIEHPIETREVNVGGTRNVLQVCKESGVKRLVFCSSAAIYGSAAPTPTPESVVPHPESPYGEDKYMGENACLEYAQSGLLETVILRYFNVYGPRQRGDSPYAGAIARFIERSHAGQPIVVYGDGLQTRDFVHVSDVVRANLLAMDTSSISGKAINIASGKSSSVRDVARIVGGTVVYEPARTEIRDSLADISLAKSILAWSPVTNLERGIEELRAFTNPRLS